MKYTFSQIRKNVFLVEAETQYDLCSMFLRPQEFYESPFENIQSKYFTLQEYMDTYAKEMGNFTYYSDWSGFNIPDDYFNLFYTTFRYDLSQKEVILWRYIDALRRKKDSKFYVIGALKGKANVLEHEIAHAYWYLYPEYQKKACEMIAKINPDQYRWARQNLTGKGYDSFVIDDEIQAYLSTTTDRKELLKVLGWNGVQGIRVPATFKKFFNEFDNSHK